MFRLSLNREARRTSLLGQRLWGGFRSRPAETRSARRPSFRPSLEALEAREVLSLSPVSANAGFPYTTICEIRETFPDNKVFVGSGVLVDSFHVLTAGHVVYSYADGGFAKSLTVTPELNGNSAPFGTAYVTYERTYNVWVNYSKAHPGLTAPGDDDIGLLTLNRKIGNSTGWMSFGYDNNNNDFAAGAILNTAGYPAAGGYSGLQMEFSSGQIAGLSSDGSAIQYYQSQITQFGGQSGSPLWRYIASTNSRVVYGIVVGGSGTANSLNFSTRITQSIFNDLLNWRAADKTPTSAPAGFGFTLTLGTGLDSSVGAAPGAASIPALAAAPTAAPLAPTFLASSVAAPTQTVPAQASPQVLAEIVSADVGHNLAAFLHGGNTGAATGMQDVFDQLFGNGNGWLPSA